MTTYNKTTLKTFFETGDIPTGTDYANFIDSQINIVETSEQDMAGNLGTPKLIASRISAGTVNITGTFSAASLNIGNINASAATFLTSVSADTLSVNVITASAASFSSGISANSLNIATDISAATGTVYASAMRSTNGIFSGSGIVSAAGTTQGAAAILTNVINRGKGVVDSTATGFAPLANRTGLVQYLLNEGISANLWPPTGGFINGLAINTPFSLAASSAYTIFHITASSYGVK